MTPVMNIDEVTDVVDFETVDVGAVAIGLTTSKIIPVAGKSRRAAIIQFQDATCIIRHDPLAANVVSTAASAEYGHEYNDGDFLILRRTNNMRRFRAISAGAGKMRVFYVG